VGSKETITVGRTIQINGIALYANTAVCAHDCSFCLLGKKPVANIPYARIAALIERLINWKEKRNLSSFQVFHWIRYSYDYDLADMKLWVNLWKRLGRIPDIMVGGLPLMSSEKMRTWLCERRDLGIKEVHASFLGTNGLHDSLCRRKGDFEYRLHILKIASELGMQLNERLLLTQQTLPYVEDVIQHLDLISAKSVKRYISPLFYMGSAATLEADRITEEIRDTLPNRFGNLFTLHQKEWSSEREWINKILDEDVSPEPVMLRLDPDESNIDALESMSCDEIVDALESQTRIAYDAIPSRQQLCAQCGDRSNQRIYALQNDIERLWLDRYLIAHPVTFDRNLTHLSMVR
jgi:hypothetical protein